MRRTERIRIAFFKGDRHEFHHRFIRWWTRSPYSHAEIVLDDGETWASISPFLYNRVAARIRTSVPPDDWDYLDFRITPEELHSLKDFISETTGDAYDWIGMLLSQVLPIIIKGKGRWYCSHWIASGLAHAGIVKLKRLGIYEFPDLHPGRLHDILSKVSDLPKDDTSDSVLITD